MMSVEKEGSNGNCLNAAELDREATMIEENFTVVNKQLVIKMFKVLNTLMNIIKRKEDGIFDLMIKWFRLYLKLHNLIDPDDKKLLKIYENTVPAIITYIIGCLQYKPKDVLHYHYVLLEILEELMQSVQPNVLRKITKFEKETISSLWNPIELVGDYNTQLKALNIFSLLLKQFDENRQNEELSSIKWTNLNFFQEKLKAIVQETKLSHVLENRSREFLNNYNMSLSKTAMVYSFFCEEAKLGKMYKFYKPLNLQQFWIDVNYCPKTLSFCGRFKFNSNSKYENINVILKIRNITLKSNNLRVYFEKPGDFSNRSEYFSAVMENFICFTLSEEEKLRLKNNTCVIEYFNHLNNSNNTKYNETDKKTLDLLKGDMARILKENKMKRSRDSNGSTTLKNMGDLQMNTSSKENMGSTLNLFDSLKQKSFDESSGDDMKKTSNVLNKSIKPENEIKKRPVRSVRNKNKFFKSLIMEESFKDPADEKPKRKRAQKRKPRQTKSNYKQVCKVIPTVDLTKIDHAEYLANKTEANESTYKTEQKDVLKTEFSLSNIQKRDEILRQVSDIYDVGDTTYAKPCQSYKSFQLQHNPSQKTITKDSTIAKDRKRKIPLESQSSVGRKRKLNYISLENKENENTQNIDATTTHCPLSTINPIISPHLFETQRSDEIPPSNKLKKDMNIENILSSSSECEEVRGLNENILKDVNLIFTPERIMLTTSSNATTPRPTSAMNVSNFSDSDMEITQICNWENRQDHQIVKTNTSITSKENMELDMELLQQGDNLKVYKNQQSEKHDKHRVDLKNNCEVLQEQMMDDFEHNSENEFNSHLMMPIKETINNFIANQMTDDNYNRDCIVFRNRQEETSSSDEDDDYDKIPDNTNYPRNCNIIKPLSRKMSNAAMEPVPNRNIRQEMSLSKSPESNFQISSNITTRRATTCQVTPSAIIIHKMQVSAQKSIIIKRVGSKNQSKVNKCLNGLFRRDAFTLQSEDVKSLKDINYTLPFHKSPKNDTDFIEIHSSEGDCCNIPTDHKNLADQQTTPTNSIYSEDTNNNHQHSSEINLSHQRANIEELKGTLKDDLFRIVNDCITNTNQRLDRIIRQGINNISYKYKHQFLDITNNVLKKSEENRLELEEIHSTIGRLVRDLEWQYDAFINKSKEFDIHREMCKNILESVTKKDVPNFISKDYDDILKRIHSEQNIVFNKVWLNLLEKHTT